MLEKEHSLRRRLLRLGGAASAAALALCLIGPGAGRGQETSNANPVLEWNQIFIDTLIATNTANASSQRLGAIVHTAIFDAYNSIEQRYSPIFIHDRAPSGASRRAAVIAAGYTALAGLFPTQKPALDANYALVSASARSLEVGAEISSGKGEDL
jgi:hypothetical protein